MASAPSCAPGHPRKSSNLYIAFTLNQTAQTQAGGWYLDDVAILQGAEISGVLAGGGNIEVCLLVKTLTTPCRNAPPVMKMVTTRLVCCHWATTSWWLPE
jgi:hypothetical protein